MGDSIFHPRTNQTFILAALDFGSTFSGYAYTYRSEYLEDKSRLFVNHWNIDGLAQANFKAPTVVLFNKDRTFDSFGYEAETRYAQLAEKEEHIGWRYFRYFKMKLYGREQGVLHRKIRLLDEQNKKMVALEVFAASIKYLADHLMRVLNNSRGGKITVKDVEWILTVPAIWTDGAKQFMQMAAVKAGLPESHISLALEPEAAAVYVSQIRVHKVHADTGYHELRPFAVKSKFMVIDLGGGTVDMTFHEVTDANSVNEIPVHVKEEGALFDRQDSGANTLAEIHAPEGGQWGGNLVNEDLEDFMETIFTERVWDQFRSEADYKECYLDMLRALEIAKKADLASTDSVNITIPTDLAELFQEIKGMSVSNHLANHQDLKHIVSFKRGKLRISSEKMKSMFERSINQLKECLRGLNRTFDVSEIQIVVLVGGFSESRVVQTAMKEYFSGRTVIIPEEPSLAVLKGAVQYGFNKKVIHSRIMKHTYGISVAKTFDERIHPQKLKVRTDKGYRCENIFEILIPAGTIVYPDVTNVSKRVNASYITLASEADVSVYLSREKEPKFITDEDCHHVGSVQFSLENQCKGTEDRLVDVTLHFGHTKITVTVQEPSSQNVIESCFNCLN